MAGRADIFAVLADGQRPDLAVVSGQRDDIFEIVGIPLFHLAVFAAREEQVRFGNELETHDAVLVGEYRSMTIAKIQSAIKNKQMIE